MDEYDVIVIGAGPAGENAVGRCADHGLSTVIIERELIGGECSYWGCIPSKTLIRPGDALAAVRRVPGAAAAVTGTIDAAAALARRDYMTSDWNDAGQVPWLDQHHVALIRGTGRLTGVREVAVNRQPLRARLAVVLATGTTAAFPPVTGLREARPWDNRNATAAKEIPRRLLVLGAGFVGAELAQGFKRLGTEEVTVVESAEQLLAREEPFAGEEVRKAFEAEGITVFTGARMTAVRRPGPDAPVTATLADGREIEADEILVATGRHPATTDLGLDTVGLTPGEWVSVDDRLCALDDWLYAVGDCNGKALLTHMGKYQGRIAADVIAGRDIRDRASATVIPRVTFTDPQVCAVGYTEAEARNAGLQVSTVTYGVGDVPGAYTTGEGIGGTSMLVIDDQRRTIVGATFTGPGLQELLHSATIAIAGEVPIERLWHAVPSFPTISEVWLHLLEQLPEFALDTD
jgi:dihydrolipoamide dehydrogenase